MSGVTGAIIGAGVIGAGASIGSGIMASDAAGDAAAQNAANVSDTNALNYKMFRQSRGDGGYSFLPFYADQGDEKALYDQAKAVSTAINSKPVDQQLAEYEEILRGLQPVIDASTGQVVDLFSGKTLDQRIAEARPVEDARIQVANAAQLALSAEHNRIQAEEMRKGFSGGGSFASNRMIQGSVAPRQQIAQATLQNALGRQQIQESDRTMRFQNMNEPMNRATSMIRLKQLPNQAVLQQFSDSMQPYSFFRLGQGNFRYDQLPTVQPVASAGQLALQGVGQLAGVAGNYYANQQILDAIRNSGAGSSVANNIQIGQVPAGMQLVPVGG